MVNSDAFVINPVKARLDISTLCQLTCQLCPTEENNGREFLRKGTMPYTEFEHFLDHNPRISTVELASAGEALLNPDLPEILRCAHERGVTTSLAGGVNMNDVSDEALDALVRYGTSRIRISVDGATEETYRKYRVGGSLRKVMANIDKLNGLKKKYRSVLPELILQFIVFGHNEHELERVVALGGLLNAKVFLKLNRCPEQLAVKDRRKIRDLIGYADRREFLEVTSTQYCADLCLCFWKSPQINWDGRLLGCCANTSISFADYALGGKFLKEINNERMRYARKMLMGVAPQRDDIPCSSCPFFTLIREHSLWFTPEMIAVALCAQGNAGTDPSCPIPPVPLDHERQVVSNPLSCNLPEGNEDTLFKGNNNP
jgi:MoaA/NifB/PqqE/SkfB family radical SAM enzyme